MVVVVVVIAVVVVLVVEIRFRGADCPRPLGLGPNPCAWTLFCCLKGAQKPAVYECYSGKNVSPYSTLCVHHFGKKICLRGEYLRRDSALGQGHRPATLKP